MDTQYELLARVLDGAALIRERENHLRRTAHELQSALRLTMRFSNIYCEL